MGHFVWINCVEINSKQHLLGLNMRPLIKLAPCIYIIKIADEVKGSFCFQVFILYEEGSYLISALAHSLSPVAI